MTRKDLLLLLIFGFVLLLPVVAAPARAEEGKGVVDCGTIVLTALEAWSAFLTSGDVTVLAEAFVPGAPQWQQLRGDAENGQVDPPVTFEVVEIVPRLDREQSVTVWAEVEARQKDRRSQTLGWDFDMVRTPDGCQVWTVVAAERPIATEVRPAGTRPTALTASTTTTPNLAAPTLNQALEAEQPPVVRLPAVVAWVIVITLGGVAAAGYLAPRLDRRES